MAQKHLECDGLLERGTSNDGTYRLYFTETAKVSRNMFFRHTSPGFMNYPGEKTELDSLTRFDHLKGGSSLFSPVARWEGFGLRIDEG